jgi:hypothetical protein
MPRKTIVLTSGGILGVSYGGVFRCMEEKGISLKDFDVVYGTSVGGMVGLLIVIGMSYLDIRRLLLNLPVQAIFNINSTSILRFADTYGLDDGSGLRKICRRVLLRMYGKETMTLGELYQRTSKIFAVNATNIQNGQSVILGTHETPNIYVEDAICATAAIPFLYTPVSLQGMVLVDGGVSESLLLKKVPPEDIPYTIAIVPMPNLEEMVVGNITDVAKSVYVTITNQSISRLIDTCTKEAMDRVIYIRTPVDPDAMLSGRANSITLRETLDFLGYTEGNRSSVIESYLKMISTSDPDNGAIPTNLSVAPVQVPVTVSVSTPIQTSAHVPTPTVSSETMILSYSPDIGTALPNRSGQLLPAEEPRGSPFSNVISSGRTEPSPPDTPVDPSRSLPPPIKTRESAGPLVSPLAFR